MRKYDWVRCTECGHKLFKIYEQDDIKMDIEIKCSSCKAVLGLEMGKLSKKEPESIYGANKGLVEAL